MRAYRQDLAKFVAFMGCHGYRLDQHMDKASARAVLRRYQIELADVLPNPRRGPAPWSPSVDFSCTPATRAGPTST